MGLSLYMFAYLYKKYFYHLAHKFGGWVLINDVILQRFEIVIGVFRRSEEYVIMNAPSKENVQTSLKCKESKYSGDLNT